MFGQLLSLLLLSDFGIGLSSTPLDILECQKITVSSTFKVDTVKSFTVVDEAAIHVLVVFTLFLTDYPRVHDLVTGSVVFPEACLSLAEFLLIVAQHSLVNNVQHYLAGMWDKCNSSIVLAVHFVPFLVDRHIYGSSKFCRPLRIDNDHQELRCLIPVLT